MEARYFSTSWMNVSSCMQVTDSNTRGVNYTCGGCTSNQLVCTVTLVVLTLFICLHSEDRCEPNNSVRDDEKSLQF